MGDYDEKLTIKPFFFLFLSHLHVEIAYSTLTKTFKSTLDQSPNKISL
jgi:hypothetical protein